MNMHVKQRQGIYRSPIVFLHTPLGYAMIISIRIPKLKIVLYLYIFMYIDRCLDLEA